MTLRTPIRRISSKRLAQMGGKVFSTIQKRTKPRRKRPWLTCKAKQERVFLDPRSYVTKGGRVRLFGQDYQALGGMAWYRSGGKCECGCGRRAPSRALLRVLGETASMADIGELSHNEHGARKSDEIERVKWMRHECHMKSHNCGGKPVPRKPKISSMEE